jgi:glyoxylase-like metal-dependent hydrolase (beta-lactamase superfamily II)
VYEAGRFDLIQGEHEIVQGVWGLPMPGHTPHHQGILLQSRGDTAFFIADLVPTTTHVPLAWIMGYDLEPLVTLETKRRTLALAADEGWQIAFPHDAFTAWGRLRREANAYTLDSLDGTA